jgi:hypothetical protein
MHASQFSLGAIIELLLHTSESSINFYDALMPKLWARVLYVSPVKWVKKTITNN